MWLKVPDMVALLLVGLVYKWRTGVVEAIKRGRIQYAEYVASFRSRLPFPE